VSREPRDDTNGFKKVKRGMHATCTPAAVVASAFLLLLWSSLRIPQRANARNRANTDITRCSLLFHLSKIRLGLEAQMSKSVCDAGMQRLFSAQRPPFVTNLNQALAKAVSKAA